MAASSRALAQRSVWRSDVTATRLAKKALEEAEVYLDDDAYAERYADEHDEYKDSPFNKEALAVGFLKYPNVDAYKLHKRFLYCYEDLIADEITDDVLETRIDRMDFFIGAHEMDTISAPGQALTGG